MRTFALVNQKILLLMLVTYMYMYLKDTMHTQGSRSCSACHNDLHSYENICCDGCLDWECTGLKRAPKGKH